MPAFIVFDLTQPGIQPETTVSVYLSNQHFEKYSGFMSSAVFRDACTIYTCLPVWQI